jgi:hypothetical protein
LASLSEAVAGARFIKASKTRLLLERTSPTGNLIGDRLLDGMSPQTTRILALCEPKSLAKQAHISPAKAAKPLQKYASSRYGTRLFPWTGKMHCRSAGGHVETGAQLAYQ